MSRQSSSSYGDTHPGTDRASSTTSSSIRWAPHGRGMTACLVVVNVVLVALVYIYFWRVFTRKPAATAASASASNPMDHDDDDASSAASAPPSSPPTSRDHLHDRLVASLPRTFVARSGSGAGAECAVCIAELRDGDEGRSLPRCGHQFHAACVDSWLRLRHTTCPLCRASVVVVVAAEEEGPKGNGVTDTTTAAALEDMDAPV